jgi:hypothetical protein
MSGSPTAAEIRLRQEEERRLAEERRRKAEEERRRREEAERRARVALANQLWAALVEEAGRVRLAVGALRASASALSVPGGIPHVEAQVDEVIARASTEPEAIAAALGKVQVIARSVAALGGNLAAQAAATASEQDAIRREAAAEAARLAGAARSEEAARQGAITAATAELSARLAGIEADEVTMAWCADEVRAVAEAIANLAASSDLTDAALALNARLDAALARAQDRQLAEERRAYIVTALQDGLREQGFQVGEATLVGSGYDGEVAFRAVRADRRWVDVNVPVEGHVFYDVDGTDRVTERRADGAAYTSCDETEARLEALHADLAERFGVAAGELFWETKDPKRQRRNANSLPSGGPAATRKQG